MALSTLVSKARTFSYFTPVIKRKKHTYPSGLTKVFLILNSERHYYIIELVPTLALATSQLFDQQLTSQKQ